MLVTLTVAMCRALGAVPVEHLRGDAVPAADVDHESGGNGAGLRHRAAVRRRHHAHHHVHGRHLHQRRGQRG